MVTEKTLLTAEQFLDRPDDGCRYELLDGELHQMTPPSGRHGTIQGRIVRLLGNYVEEQNLDFWVGGESGVILRRNPDRVRAPDVYVIDRARLPNGEMPDGFLPVVPDLIVKIVSPTDRATDIQEKVQEWRDAGARLVVVVYPRTRSLLVYRGESVQQCQASDEFSADPVLPGFRSPVARFFE